MVWYGNVVNVQLQIFSFECRIAGSERVETMPRMLCKRDEIIQYAYRSCLVRSNLQPRFNSILATNKSDLPKLSKTPCLKLIRRKAVLDMRPSSCFSGCLLRYLHSLYKFYY